VRFGEFELDEANALLLRGGSAIALSPTPFGLLCALARHPGALLTKHALLDEVWGHRFVSNSVLKGAISDVRTVLDDDPQHPRFIETVPRRGYRFIAVSTVLSAESPPSVSASLMRPESHVTEQASASARTLTVEPTPVLFVGRAKELASLRRAWDRVTSGKRVVFWIAGEPGTGKTTLIDRFVSGLGEIACARGHCLQHYGSGEPYHPVLEALAELCRSDTAVPPLLRAVAPTWLLQLPWLSTAEQREALLRELVGVNLERMLREMGEFLDRYTERRPLLLVTEDVHWGDRATIQLMDYIARRRGNGRLMWLASFRPTEIILHDHPFKALRNELRLHGLCEEIVLDPFSEKEVAEYVAQRAPSFAASEGFVRALHERADGLPLLVNHVMNDLIARGTLGGDDASAPLRLGRIAIPENLAGIIDQYVARLANEQRVVLEAAAVCGSEFRVGAVAAALERDAASVAVIRDELARGHLRLSPSLAEDRTTVVRPWPRCVTTRRPPSRPYCTSARLKQ
jgi:DNA-binding winged helix-turn-helix (wHTH) protein